jgi:hypothetical protein
MLLISGEAAINNIIVIGFIQPRYEPTIYRTRGQLANQLHHRCGYNDFELLYKYIF